MRLPDRTIPSNGTVTVPTARIAAGGGAAYDPASGPLNTNCTVFNPDTSELPLMVIDWDTDPPETHVSGPENDTLELLSSSVRVTLVSGSELRVNDSAAVVRPAPTEPRSDHR